MAPASHNFTRFFGVHGYFIPVMRYSLPTCTSVNSTLSPGLILPISDLSLSLKPMVIAGQLRLLIGSWTSVTTPSAALMSLTTPTPLCVVAAPFLLTPVSFMSIDFMSMLFISIPLESFLFTSLVCARTTFGTTTLRTANRTKVALRFMANSLKFTGGLGLFRARRQPGRCVVVSAQRDRERLQL